MPGQKSDPKFDKEVALGAILFTGVMVFFALLIPWFAWIGMFYSKYWDWVLGVIGGLF